MTPLVRLGIIAAFSLCPVFAAETTNALSGIDFPGVAPGVARAAESGHVFTLENEVIATSWQVLEGRLAPLTLLNKLTGQRFDQRGAELFRIATGVRTQCEDGVAVAIRLDTKKVTVLAARDGVAWTELASFPRDDFAGEPRLVRIGKMNLKALAKDNPGDLGAPGDSLISEITPLPPELPGARYSIKAGAHQAATREYPFPSGARVVSCRIDKGTDEGLSWGPALALVWEDGSKFLLVGVREKAPVFNITTAAGETMRGGALAQYPSFDLPASAFKPVGKPRLVKLLPEVRGARVADRQAGVAIEADFVSERGIHARWRAELRDGANYSRQTVSLSSPEKAFALSGVELSDVRMADMATVGQCPGCPIAGGGMFFGVEMPGAQNAVGSDGARIGFGCQLPLSPGDAYEFGAVAGVAPDGQLRRSFLCYIERERARPSHPFLHYNCWYDLGYGLDEARFLDVVTRFDEELVKKRGVPVMSYLADDGWDDPGKGLWVENAGKFPAGLRGLGEKLSGFGTHLGIWISPLGGYGGAKERTEWAQKMHLIPQNGALDLAEPAYRNWFQGRCLQLMREDGVNAFKWDKAGNGVTPHFMALLDVARALRRQNPDVFINVTVGTWPSPFWLNHIDSTWRDGSSDVGWTGKGDDREMWLTFRDGYCRKMFVEKSPLYPLNSAMHHGIVHGRCFQGDKVGKSGANLKNEARSYFANGASLQELYLTPSMMTSDAWDRVAEAARWAHANADVLRDAHWMGGDPLALQPYGYAAWSPRKGTLMIRNPDAEPRTIGIDAQAVFELPSGAPSQYVLTSPYGDQRLRTLNLTAGKTQEITLEPFEVLVFDAVPK